MGPDWSDGDYAHTAARLEPIAEVVVERLGLAAGHRVLDVGCGNGNAAIAAARRGADVTVVDPAEGLLTLARRRAGEHGLAIAFLRGDADALPVSGGFDVVMSVFGVIFAADAAEAIRELLRVTRPGGIVALTSWCRDGAINAAADVLFQALPKRDGPVARWDDAEWIESLLAREGAERVTIDQAEHVFRAESPEAWFAETEERHPVWRWARRLMPAERWDRVRRQSVAALHAGNEDPDRFATTSRYVIVQATRQIAVASPA